MNGEIRNRWLISHNRSKWVMVRFGNMTTETAWAAGQSAALDWGGRLTLVACSASGRHLRLDDSPGYDRCLGLYSRPRYYRWIFRHVRLFLMYDADSRPWWTCLSRWGVIIWGHVFRSVLRVLPTGKVLVADGSPVQAHLPTIHVSMLNQLATNSKALIMHK